MEPETYLSEEVKASQASGRSIGATLLAVRFAWEVSSCMRELWTMRVAMGCCRRHRAVVIGQSGNPSYSLVSVVWPDR